MINPNRPMRMDQNEDIEMEHRDLAGDVIMRVDPVIRRVNEARRGRMTWSELYNARSRAIRLRGSVAAMRIATPVPFPPPAFF